MNKTSKATKTTKPKELYLQYTHPAQTNLINIKTVHPLSEIIKIPKYAKTYKTYFTPVDYTWADLDATRSKIDSKQSTGTIAPKETKVIKKKTRLPKNTDES